MLLHHMGQISQDKISWEQLRKLQKSNSLAVCWFWLQEAHPSVTELFLPTVSCDQIIPVRRQTMTLSGCCQGFSCHNAFLNKWVGETLHTALLGQKVSPDSSSLRKQANTKPKILETSHHWILSNLPYLPSFVSSIVCKRKMPLKNVYILFVHANILFSFSPMFWSKYSMPGSVVDLHWKCFDIELWI